MRKKGGVRLTNPKMMDRTIIGCWNVRGLNDCVKDKLLTSYCGKKGISIMAFLETKVKAKFEEEVASRLMRNWKVCTNSGAGNSAEKKGRIWLTWDPSIVEVEVNTIAHQYIHCEVKTVDGKFEF